ncbi:MAG TPA: hypothetical protein VNL36_01500 [Bacteroidota bacterium]|nr:hypothetical protein [Bacteroidota bacterium]
MRFFVVPTERVGTPQNDNSIVTLSARLLADTLHAQASLPKRSGGQAAKGLVVGLMGM